MSFISHSYLVDVFVYGEYQGVYSLTEQIEVKDGRDENFSKWSKCLGVKLQFESKKTLELKTYAEQLEYLRTYIENRFQWMDKAIKNSK